MKGFAEKWKDLPDYILGITKEIWEERGIDTLNHYYTKDIPCLLYTSPSPRDGLLSRMPSSA